MMEWKDHITEYKSFKGGLDMNLLIHTHIHLYTDSPPLIYKYQYSLGRRDHSLDIICYFLPCSGLHSN